MDAPAVPPVPLDPSVPAAVTPASSSWGPAHFYDSHWSEVVRNILMTCATVLAAGVFALAFGRSRFAPPSLFRSDPDSTIIATKAALARSPANAGVAFVGDSSCLINIDIDTLEYEGGLNAVNLGTLSYLSIESFGALARQFVTGKEAGRVVLVVHPECLRSATASEAHRAVLDGALGLSPPVQLRTNNLLASWLGFDNFRDRVMDRWVPGTLSGKFGARYGFTEFLERELIRRRGTLDETARFDPSTNRMSAEYRLAGRIERECRGFRSLLPPGTRIRVVVSPVPKSHALKNHEHTVNEMRTQIEEWLGAEGPSIDLPSILPDTDFGTVTHLQPEAALRYSKLVAERLGSWR